MDVQRHKWLSQLPFVMRSLAVMLGFMFGLGLLVFMVTVPIEVSGLVMVVPLCTIIVGTLLVMACLALAQWSQISMEMHDRLKEIERKLEK